MEVQVNFIGFKHYEWKWNHVKQWAWYFRPFTIFRGFQIRIFGIHFKVMEGNKESRMEKIKEAVKKDREKRIGTENNR